MTAKSLCCGFAALSGMLVLAGCGAQSDSKQPLPEKAEKAATINPYANNNGDQLPPEYKGPRYTLNHNYPAATPAVLVDPPWQKALGGKPIGPSNAIAYAQALKQYVSADLQTLVNDYKNWNPEAKGWFDQPWIALKIDAGKHQWPGREPIQGSYPGPSFTNDIYPNLKSRFMQDYVVVYYDKTAAYTLHEMWQKTDPHHPQPGSGQFAEGSVIIKLALTSAGGDVWEPMKGAAESAVFVPPPAAAPPTPNPPAIVPVYAMQMDIVVKDSRTAPKSGWVFTTLVYSKDAAGTTPWDKMVPLGAAWGNDPGVSDTNLKETVINPVAPAYAKITLGWGGRLSGPNDAAADKTDGKLQAFSSCLSCHGTAEAPGDAPLVPTLSPIAPPIPPDSPWWQWFQDRNGKTPQSTTGQHVGLDYDMVSRQALLNWDASGGTEAAKARLSRHIEMLRARGHRATK